MTIFYFLYFFESCMSYVFLNILACLSLTEVHIVFFFFLKYAKRHKPQNVLECTHRAKDCFQHLFLVCRWEGGLDMSNPVYTCSTSCPSVLFVFKSNKAVEVWLCLPLIPQIKLRGRSWQIFELEHRHQNIVPVSEISMTTK